MLSQNATVKDFVFNLNQFSSDIVLSNDGFLIPQIVTKFRMSASRSYETIKDFYLESIRNLQNGIEIDRTMDEILNTKEFDYLVKQVKRNTVQSDTIFNRETKSELFFQEPLSSALKCKICGGYIHVNSISVDHIVRVRDNGEGSVDNAQVVHPFCNTGYKN